MRIAFRLGEARLGDAHTAFAARFSAPAHVTTLAGCVLRQYAGPSGLLSVLFVQGHSIALHYPTGADRASGTPPPALRAVLPADLQACILQRCAGGWLAALRSCPLAFLVALEGTVTGKCKVTAAATPAHASAEKEDDNSLDIALDAYYVQACE